jgi:hypothetical protein
MDKKTEFLENGLNLVNSHKGEIIRTIATMGLLNPGMRMETQKLGGITSLGNRKGSGFYMIKREMRCLAFITRMG